VSHEKTSSQARGSGSHLPSLNALAGGMSDWMSISASVSVNELLSFGIERIS